jgi:hypothetical protein
VKCGCKHKHTDHEPKPPYRCKKELGGKACNCTAFDARWVCNCGHGWGRHETAYTTAQVPYFVPISHYLTLSHDTVLRWRSRVGGRRRSAGNLENGGEAASKVGGAGAGAGGGIRGEWKEALRGQQERWS